MPPIKETDFDASSSCISEGLQVSLVEKLELLLMMINMVITDDDQ